MDEELPDDQSIPAESISEERVNVVDPISGKLQSVPASQLELAQSEGFTPATEQDVANYKKEEKYGSTTQQVIAGLEGAASSATFGLSTAAERALGVDPEDIQARREINPSAHGLGQVAGLVGSSLLLPGAGAAGLIAKGGNAAAKVAGLAAAEGVGAKIAAGAIKGAAESMLVSAGDEVSKMFAGNYTNPGEAAQTAITNTLLSGLLAAPIGGVASGTMPLWKATAGKKIDSLLHSLTTEVAGAEAVKAAKLAGAELTELGEDYFKKVNKSNPLLTEAKDFLGNAALDMLGINNSVRFAIKKVLPAAQRILGVKDTKAVTIGLLKTLASDQPVAAQGFRSMVQQIQNTIRGETLIAKATRGVFDASIDVIPTKLMPNESNREKLNKRLEEFNEDPSKLFEMEDGTGHYLADQAVEKGRLAANAVTYLNSLRPMTQRLNPLDKDIEPTPAQQYDYNRALDIANQPLAVLKDIKSGTITPKDVVHLQHLYPALHTKLVNKLTDQMIDTMAKDVHIPYNTRLGISMFMAKPLDSTMTPQGIQAAQPKPQMPPPPQGMSPRRGRSGSMKNITKLPNQYLTPDQARVINKSKPS